MFFVRFVCVALLVALAAGCGQHGARPSIVIITLDATRADRIGCYGSSFASTPAIDAFSQHATLFTNAVTPIPITLPAHTSLFTGRTPLTHGVRDNGWLNVSPDLRLLPNDLAAEGYTTAAFVSSPALDKSYFLARGFQVYDDEISGDRRAAETTSRVIAWLEKQPAQPFLLWVHYIDPHDPHEPAEPFASQTRGSAYDAEISEMDAGIGQVLATLERLGFARNAHIIMIADHGEALGQHFGYEGHGLQLYEDSERIPLLWSTPGQKTSARTNALVGTIDICPTIMDLLDLPADNSFEGVSIAKLLEGKSQTSPRGLYCETLRPFLAYGWSPQYAWRTDDRKYIDGPAPELFDLGADPSETQNLIGRRPALAESLRTELMAYVERWEPDSLVRRGMIDPEDQSALESLGYLQSVRRRRRISEGVPRPGELAALPDPKTHIRFEENFIEGKLARRRGEWERALAIYGEVVAAVPESPAVCVGMADALLGTGHPEEALAWIERHLSTRPNDGHARRLQGQVLFALGRHAEADRIFQQLFVDEDDVDLRLWRARAAIMLDSFSTASEELRDLQAAIPKKELADNWIAATETLGRHGVKLPAEQDPDLLEQVQAMVTMGLLNEARTLVNAARPARPDSLTAALDGFIARGANDWPAARDAFERAVEHGARSDLIRASLQEARQRSRPASKRKTGQAG